MEYIIIPALLFLILYFYYYYKKDLRLKIQAEEHKRAEEQKQKVRSQTGSLVSFFKDLSDFLTQKKYISNFEIIQFRSSYNFLFDIIDALDYKDLPDFDTEITTINQFLYDYTNLLENTERRNEEFAFKELKESNSILSNIEGKSLDDQQRRAIIIDQDNNLVIAGAGSGKTTTIAGKVKYLTKRLQIDKNKILLISFTRKSADEMSERISKKMRIKISVKTFHKLGLDIIGEALNEKPSVFSLSSKEQTELIESFIKYSKSSKAYFDKLLDFLAYHLKPYISPHKFTSDKDHNNYLKDQKLEGYKIIERITKDGVKIKYRERFKSQEEVLIANYLFRNQINYVYEEQYKYKTASKKFGQYKPDFYLPDYEIYIEHFGIDKDGNVPSWFKGDGILSAQEKYTKGIEWKRNEHLERETTLIETYSWEQSEGNLLTNLKKKLLELDVVFNPLPDDEFWEYLSKNAPEDINAFTILVSTFLALFKSNNETIKNLIKRANQDQDERALLFLELFAPILTNYNNFLDEEKKIDFSDMINMASDLVSDNKFISNYDYIIIDEFQDISQSRYQLIKTLLDQKPSTKLFCVGDDWQSVYRFAGSDIGIFTGFEDYFKTSTLKGFDRKTNISYIEQTYRFDDKLIELSSNFILKNPNQITKSLRSNINGEKEPTTIHTYEDREGKGKNIHLALNTAITEIIEAVQDNPISILLLGRYDFERKVIEQLSYIKIKYDKLKKEFEYEHNTNKLIDISFLTAHSAKGLESDYVIILNGNSGKYGFPSEISDDPLLNFLLSKADQFPNGEERRLFYVALTRARKHVHILSSIESPSKFINEIQENESVTNLKCEWCDNGKLIERNGPYGSFYACNNHHYCNYTRKIEASDFSLLATQYANSKNFEKATEYFLKSLSIENNNANTHYELAKVYEQNKNFNEALIHFNVSIEMDSTKAYAYYWRASVFFDLKDYAKAINDWLNFNELMPNNSSVNYWLAKSYFNANYIIKAIDSINKEILINPNNKNALICKNHFYEALKKRYSSKEGYVKTTEIASLKGYIQLAIEFDLNIKFDYHKSIDFDGGVKSLRTIRPTGFKNMGKYDTLCVIGYCYMREEERSFNVERISNLSINPTEIEYWSE
ncbi:MAG: UvrD-helicase domain-containing protein [Chitinophagales bacterium]